MVGIDPKHMSHIETGRSFPKADLIEKFAKALEIDYREFYKSEHLQHREVLIENIKANITNLSDNDLKHIYKLISVFFK